MAIDRTHGRRLVMIGASALGEPSGWLFSSDAALAELASQVVREGEPAVVQRVAASSPLCSQLPRAVRGRAITIDRSTASSLGVSTRGSWHDFSARLSSRTARKLAGLRERSERELGAWDCTMHDAGPGDVAGLMETLVSIEGSGWKGRQGSALAGRPDLFRFFDGYARRAAERGRLRISVLRLGSRVAAAELAVEAYGRLWGLKIAYDEEFSAYAPALQLAHASIQSAFTRALESYEFLGSAESWQERWKPEAREYRVMALYPLSVRGLIGLASDGMGVLARQVTRTGGKRGKR